MKISKESTCVLRVISITLAVILTLFEFPLNCFASPAESNDWDETVTMDGDIWENCRVVTIESTEQKGPFSFDVYCDDSGSVNVVLSIDNSFLVDYVQVDIHIYDIEDKELIFSGHAAIGKEVIEISDLLPGTQYKIDANTTKDVNTTVFTGIFCIISKDDVLSIEYQLTE